tara:strand:+ start:1683 stop:2330 length:648 start_codon:yes stop_codon:yes gene_type:complete
MSNLKLSDVVVDTWVQGGSITLSDLVGSVVLIEVFQVNCPGCFLYALPKAVKLFETYQDKGLVIIGLATAFEDYDKNTLENLQGLVETGEVVGETFKALRQRGMLTGGKLGLRLPFAVGMDRVVPDTEPVTDERVMCYAREVLVGFETFEEGKKQAILSQVRSYLEQKTMRAMTFERFSLQGTPSSILFDRQGQLRDVSFGQSEHQERLIEQCLV